MVHSTDNYFVENGVYTFDANKLQEFHLRNLKEGKLCLISSNTLYFFEYSSISYVFFAFDQQARGKERESEKV